MRTQFVRIPLAYTKRNATRIFTRRTFASSSSPQLPDRLTHFFTTGYRCLSRLDSLSTYNQKKLFGPQHASALSAWKLFWQLQLPEQTEIDLEEFLQGAQAAGKTEVMAVNSHEFSKYVTGQLEQSQIAEDLKSYCNPRFYHAMADASRAAYEDRNIYMEMQNMDVSHIYVSDIKYCQLTEEEYEYLLENMPSVLPAPQNWSPEATIEYLQVDVVARTTEIIKMTLEGKEECVVEQVNGRQWTFASKVTTPNEVDWRIVDGYAMNGSAKELSRRVFNEQATTYSNEVPEERKDEQQEREKEQEQEQQQEQEQKR